jgi:hypothetical protein
MDKKNNIDEIDDAVLGQRVKKLYEIIKNKPLITHHYYLEVSAVIEGLLSDEEKFQHELEMVKMSQNHYEKFCEKFGISYNEENNHE